VYLSEDTITHVWRAIPHPTTFSVTNCPSHEFYTGSVLRAKIRRFDGEENSDGIAGSVIAAAAWDHDNSRMGETFSQGARGST
jgi:hypothetical protein